MVARVYMCRSLARPPALTRSLLFLFLALTSSVHTPDDGIRRGRMRLGLFIHLSGAAAVKYKHTCICSKQSLGVNFAISSTRRTQIIFVPSLWVQIGMGMEMGIPFSLTDQVDCGIEQGF